MVGEGRLDLPKGLDYGKKKELEDQQAQVSAIPSDQIGLTDAAPGRPIGRESEFPNESLFAGSKAGPGVGPEALQFPNAEEDQDAEMLAEVVPILEAMVDNRKHTSARMRQMVRKMRADMPVDGDRLPTL